MSVFGAFGISSSGASIVSAVDDEATILPRCFAPVVRVTVTVLASFNFRTFGHRSWAPLS
jgi:hypothetical protein